MKATDDECKANKSDMSDRQRELGLLWLTAKTLVHIDEKLTDLVTLQQQAVDLLRRILRQERTP
jgi:hypothetical protein